MVLFAQNPHCFKENATFLLGRNQTLLLGGYKQKSHNLYYVK